MSSPSPVNLDPWNDIVSVHWSVGRDWQGSMNPPVGPREQYPADCAAVGGPGHPAESDQDYANYLAQRQLYVDAFNGFIAGDQVGYSGMPVPPEQQPIIFVLCETSSIGSLHDDLQKVADEYHTTVTSVDTYSDTLSDKTDHRDYTYHIMLGKSR
jgi:hypothetical protein